MQYNPPPGPYSTGYPQQIQGQTQGIRAPLQPNTQRAYNSGQFNVNQSSAPPEIGWNLTVADQTPSPWGQRNVSPCFNQANPFQDDFVPNAVHTTASASSANNDRLSARSLHRSTVLTPNISPQSSESPSPNSSLNTSSLITLSPVNTLQQNKDTKKLDIQHGPGRTGFYHHRHHMFTIFH